MRVVEGVRAGVVAGSRVCCFCDSQSECGVCVRWRRRCFVTCIHSVEFKRVGDGQAFVNSNHGGLNFVRSRPVMSRHVASRRVTSRHVIPSLPPPVLDGPPPETLTTRPGTARKCNKPVGGSTSRPTASARPGRVTTRQGRVAIPSGDGLIDLALNMCQNLQLAGHADVDPVRASLLIELSPCPLQLVIVAYLRGGFQNLSRLPNSLDTML